VSDRIPFSCRLPKPVADELQRLSDALGYSKTQVICHALAHLSRHPSVAQIEKARKKLRGRS